MKKLFLLRHAQTQPLETGQEDIVRDLTPQGTLDASALGRSVKNMDYRINFALCSAARRTKQTLGKFMESFGSVKNDTIQKMYNASCGDLLSLIQKTDDNVQNLLMVAHNPGIYELAGKLISDEDNPALLKLLSSGYKPATLSIIEYSGDHWIDIQPGANRLEKLMEPIDYNAPATPARWT